MAQHVTPHPSCCPHGSRTGLDRNRPAVAGRERAGGSQRAVGHSPGPERPKAASSVNRQNALSTSLVTVEEAATDLRMSLRSLRRWIAAKEVEVVRFGRAIRIPSDEVQRLAKVGLPVARRRGADTS